MDRPKVKTETREYLDWHELSDAVEKLLSERQGRKVNIRDYAERHSGEFDKDAPYQDFWHWWLEVAVEEGAFYNGCMQQHFHDELGEADVFAPWQREIYDVFGELLTEEQRRDGVWFIYEW